MKSGDKISEGMSIAKRLEKLEWKVKEMKSDA
jgi:hypothetical protein